MTRIDVLKKNYQRLCEHSWDHNVAGAQRVWLAVYEKEDERKLRLRLGLFAEATQHTGRKWAAIDLTDAFADWMCGPDNAEFAESYFGMKTTDAEAKPPVGRIGNPSRITNDPTASTTLGRIANSSYIYERLAEAGCRPGASLDDWLRDSFFEQHCKRFHHRPFIWHVWDGRKDGFSCLVNYHKLDQARLESLTYSYLGDWITAQSKSDKVGADLRLAAAQGLQEKLKLILAGEPPYDIFVRWKPLHEQAIGWHPDLNDGVRMNIRPFMTAGILRKNPNIKWGKDRGKEPMREKDGYPWFWKEGEFVGERVNDVHLSNAQKQAARDEQRPAAEG